MNESELVEASRMGDRNAFGLLIDQYYKGVYRLVYQYTGSHHDSDDICQETFLLAFRGIKNLRSAASFRSWLYKIATNLGRQHIRHSRRDQRRMPDDQERIALEEATDMKPGPPAVASAEEKISSIPRLLQEMSEEMRLVTGLVIFEGLSQKEAAEVLGVSEPSVSRHLNLSRRWLRARLGG